MMEVLHQTYFASLKSSVSLHTYLFRLCAMVIVGSKHIMMPYYGIYLEMTILEGSFLEIDNVCIMSQVGIYNEK